MKLRLQHLMIYFPRSTKTYQWLIMPKKLGLFRIRISFVNADTWRKLKLTKGTTDECDVKIAKVAKHLSVEDANIVSILTWKNHAKIVYAGFQKSPNVPVLLNLNDMLDINPVFLCYFSFPWPYYDSSNQPRIVYLIYPQYLVLVTTFLTCNLLLVNE